jgi:hypothetical protein
MKIAIRNATATTVDCTGRAIEATGVAFAATGIVLGKIISVAYFGTCGALMTTGQLMQQFSQSLSSKNKDSIVPVKAWKEGKDINLDIIVFNAKPI